MSRDDGKMKDYDQKLIDKIVKESKFTPIRALARKYKIPRSTIITWKAKGLSKESAERTVRQRFYNIFPLAEAKITSAYSDYVVCGITDEEWEQLSKVINKILFDVAYEVWATLENINDGHSRKIKTDENDKETFFSSFYNREGGLL